MTLVFGPQSVIFLVVFQKFWGPKLFSIGHFELKLYGCQCFTRYFYYLSTIYAKSHEKSHRLWTEKHSLARGLLALQIKIPLRNHFHEREEYGLGFIFDSLASLLTIF